MSKGLIKGSTWCFGSGACVGAGFVLLSVPVVGQDFFDLWVVLVPIRN